MLKGQRQTPTGILKCREVRVEHLSASNPSALKEKRNSIMSKLFKQRETGYKKFLWGDTPCLSRPIERKYLKKDFKQLVIRNCTTCQTISEIRLKHEMMNERFHSKYVQ
jgi:hypothetical protein